MSIWHSEVLIVLFVLLMIAGYLIHYLIEHAVIPWIERNWEAIQEAFTGRIIDTTPMVNKIIEESIVKVSPAVKYEDVYPVPMPIMVRRRGEIIDDNMLEVF